MSKIVPEEKAKQGRSGFQVLAVLMVALVLASGAWMIAEFYGTATAPTNPGQAEQTQQTGKRPAGWNWSRQQPCTRLTTSEHRRGNCALEMRDGTTNGRETGSEPLLGKVAVGTESRFKGALHAI
jgi:hypothetical protein